jgi:hypothetical protein
MEMISFRTNPVLLSTIRLAQRQLRFSSMSRLIRTALILGIDELMGREYSENADVRPDSGKQAA